MRKNNCVFNCLLCRTCSSEWKELIDIKRVRKNFRKGQQLIREGEPFEGLYFVERGALKVHKIWTPEKDLIIRWATEGDLIGHRGYGSPELYPVSATCLADTEACFIGKDFLTTSLMANAVFCYELLNLFSNELKVAEERMKQLGLMDVKARIAVCLLEMERKFGTDKDGFIRLNISRQDIASYSGTIYETVFKFFSELQKLAIIETRQKKISIKEPDQLMAYVSS